MILWVALIAAAGDAEIPLDLDAAVERARAVAADVVIAKEDVVLVDAEYMAALSVILPRVDLAASAGEIFGGEGVLESRERGFRVTSIPGEPIDVDNIVGSIGPFRDFRVGAYSNPSFGLQFQVSQLIFDGGRWWTQLARVGDVEASRRATLDRILAELRVNVARAFYAHEAARQGLEVIAAQVSSDERQADRARALLEAGRAKSADVAAAARNLALDKSELARKQLQLRQASRRMNFLLGRPPSTPVLLQTPDFTGALALPTFPSADELVAGARRSRPELVAIEAEIAAAEKTVVIAEADYYPTVGLGANYRKQSRRPDRTFGDPTEGYTASIDLTVRWNIFEGRATAARVGQAEVNLRKISARKDELLRSIDGEVHDVLDQIQLQVELVKLARDASAAALEAQRLAQGLFDEGRGTLLEVRDAELQVLQARLSGITARLDVEIAREQLNRTVGAQP